MDTTAVTAPAATLRSTARVVAPFHTLEGEGFPCAAPSRRPNSPSSTPS
ncbi:hypothetical protein ACWD0G_25905 [Streptomyces goshikiensis]